MGFVGDQDDIRARIQDGVIQFVLPKGKLLDGGENNLAAGSVQQGTQVADTFSLPDIPNQHAGSQELIVELVIQIIAVHFDNEDRIFKFRLAAQDANQEGHRKGLPEPVVCQMTPMRRSGEAPERRRW